MTLKRICSVLLASVIFTCNIAANTVFGVGSVCAMEIQGADEVSAPIMPVAEFDSEDGMITALDEYLPCTMVNDNVRMFENTMKISASADGEQSYFVMRDFTWDFASDEYSGYNYLNFWIYVPETPPVNADGEPSDLCVMLRTRENSNIKAYYSLIPMEQVGWQLVTIDRNSFLNRSANATWENTSAIKEIVFFTNVEESVVSGASAWNEDGSGYILMDYIYLSKEIPKTVFNIASSSVQDGAVDVPDSIDGNKTVSILAEREILSNSVDLDKFELRLNGDIITDGFNIKLDNEDNSKINITFDNNLDLSSEYSISINPEGIYDEYGNTLEEPFTISFKTSDYLSEYEIESTYPENRAEEVPVDLNGFYTCEITMNNPPSSEVELQNGISVLKNGTKLQDGFTVNVDGKIIKVIMKSELEYNSQYAIELSDSLTDIAGNTISGNKKISFKTESKVLDTLNVIDMADESSYSSNLGTQITLTEENTNIYDKALRIEIPPAITSSDIAQLRRNYSSNEPLDASEYSYLNYWIYSEKKTESGLNFLCYTSSGNYRYHISLDWTGWKLVTIPLSSFYVLANSPNWDKITEIRINANGYTGYITPWANGGYFLVDKIFFSKEAPTTFDYQGSSVPDAYSLAPVKDFEVGFMYSDEVASIDADAVTVIKDGTEQTVEVDVKAVGSQVLVKMNEKLEYNTKYNIKLSNNVFDNNGQKSITAVNYSFTTASDGFSVSKPVFSSYVLAPEKNIYVTSMVANDTAMPQNIVLTTVQYDIDGYPLDILDIAITVNAGEEIQIKADVTVMEETSVIRAFVCDNVKDRNLLRADYSFVGIEDEVEQKCFGSATEQESLSLNGAMDIDKLNISGTYNGAGIILARVISPEDKDVLLVPTYAASEDNYSYLYSFDDALSSGEYTVKASTFSGNSQSAKIYYLAENDRDYALKLANENGDFKSLLLNNKEYFGVSELNDIQIGGIAKTVTEQRTYDSFEDIVVTIDTAMQVLKQLNSTAWAGMSVLLEEYHNIILYENTNYSYYSSLSAAKRNEINREIEKAMPVNSFEEFGTVFNQEVSEYKSNSSVVNNSGGGGSSGGGVGSTIQNSNKVAMVEITLPKQTVAPTVQEPNEEVLTNTESVFNDIDDYLWAKSSIEKLYDMNVISASEDGKFRPSDNVTREEFVKMLVMALEIKVESTDSDFADTIEGAWYQPYVSAAQRLGIVSGKDNGNFGVGEHITRQDMAAMTYRAVRVLDKEFEVKSEAIQFTDFDDISEYATEAVEAMQVAGVISGMENNEFCPLLFAQRAQAAKVITGLIEALK